MPATVPTPTVVPAPALPPFTARTRNLVRFCRHLPHEQLDDAFAADFGFRAAHSRFSLLKNYGTLPGPDDCFSHLQLDARPLFVKLLGLELEYPGAPRPLQPYSSMNYYRSHIEEVFHHTGAQVRPFPPIRGRCVTCFSATDVLQVDYELVNHAATAVPLRLRWFSVPATGLSHHTELQPNGFRHACVQQVTAEYEATADVTGAPFVLAAERLESPWLEVTLAAHETRRWTFVVRLQGALAPAPAVDGLADAIARTEARYAALPALPAALAHFEPLALRAAGIILSNRFLETTPQGERLPVIHGGKCGVEATWFWDSATAVLGLGLLQDAATGWGTIRLLCDGIAADGHPFVRYCSGSYADGAQNPILAWGVWNFYALCPDRAQLARAYQPLQRYVQWWRRSWATTGITAGLYTFAADAGCTGLDDALQWQDQFPIALRPGESWQTKDWGRARPDRFASVDINCQVYLELRALACMARALALPAEAAAWEAEAAALGASIHTLLYNPAAGVYQARSVADGRFNEIVSLESFLPLYAGITPAPLAQRLCREYLLNPARFYTVLPFPTLDLAHEAFRSSGNLYAPPQHPGALVQQAYWIGRTWLNYSYWMVGALQQAGLPQEAEAAAARILDAVGRNETLYECYDPLTATGTGHAEFPWAAASVMALAFGLYRHGPLAPAPTAQ